ncbi:UDP-N-acetylmuramoyl-tripeptide--D-alanyl-D-alanine ligase [Cellulophaga sp. F20128]|uniref:UDP-N-acetylmuramoyl-tripeptide--D-alanyl-D- alanine ligase n=1 Tax=Cellulophaga sp. F20128 TaxID=2926413 RepID=UPI001FF53638|nr:UDP-N-acetylmuramoyl-tripeptide--D-alanyl-D-alanine ligase [Cellulophaga sp. F20128]MCK0156155.1 UDP-N-acetylmuramoyl-tripeptide--D-alanyl-D-alanine ligase [Cellulophaga sp. F20128]
MTIAQIHQLFLKYPTVCTDTRKITKNCIFFALKGDNFNGNSYAEDAIKKGAAYAIIDDEKFATSNKFIVVKDVLHTLQQVGKLHRHHCSARVIGLTGSNGKTTTKELLKAVIQKKYNTIATIGNLNNHIGVPLTLLSIQEDTEIAIVEMGANHLEEIEFLCNLAQPDYGYITNFGKAHLEGFGSTEGVIQGKSELYNYLIANNKHIFLNADDPIQENKLGNYIKKTGFSTSNEHDFKIEFVGADPFVTLNLRGTRITSNLIGSYNFTNCCAAIVMGIYFNIELPKIKEAIEGYTPQNNRSQLLEHKGYKIILDAYNANPTSMAAALDNFKAMKDKHKIVFLGDMFELGNSAVEEHQNIAELAAKMNFSATFLIGENFSKTKTTALKLTTLNDLKFYLKEHPIQPLSTLLIKGSRGMSLERILELV